MLRAVRGAPVFAWTTARGRSGWGTVKCKFYDCVCMPYNGMWGGLAKMPPNYNVHASHVDPKYQITISA